MRDQPNYPELWKKANHRRYGLWARIRAKAKALIDFDRYLEDSFSEWCRKSWAHLLLGTAMVLAGGYILVMVIVAVLLKLST